MDGQNELPQLPKGWVWARMEDFAINERNAIVDGPFGSNLKLTDYIEDETGVPVLTTKNLGNVYGRENLRYISHAKFEELKRSQVRGGDILVAKIGSVGKCGIYPMNMPIAIIPANLLKMTVHPELAKLYVFYFIKSPIFKKELEDITTATAQPAFNVTKFRRLGIPFPPLPEQHRIVAKIEELFSDLDAGVAALRKIQKQLKRYRQAVLKAAVEGKLTAEWRAVNAGRIEPVANAAELGELPEGWVLTTIDQVCNQIVDCLHSTPEFKPSGYFCIDSNSIKPGKIIREKARFVDAKTFKDRNRRMEPKENDIIFSREGALLGVAVRVLANFEFCLGQRMMIFRPSKYLNSKYYEAFLNSLTFRLQYLPKISGTASPHLNIRDIREFAIPLPPLAEQKQIVAEVERRLSVADAVERTVDASLKQAERLRQSILKRTFAGKLVPQDPNDEPAERLVERIRAARDLTVPALSGAKGLKPVRSGKHRATQSQRKKSQ